MARKFVKLTDRYLNPLVSFPDADPQTIWDAKVHGLRLRIGRHKATWSFFRQYRERGERSSIHRVLGHYSTMAGEGMSVAAARKAALQLAGKSVRHSVEAEKLTFSAAFDDYCAYLLRKVRLANEAALKLDSTAPQKDAGWHKNVQGLGRLYLLPTWGHLTLSELSARPAAVRKWHEGIEARVTANKCARVLRAVYRHARKEMRGLPPDLPTSAVKMNPEEARIAGMTDKQHRAWADAWRRIEDPMRRGFQLASILSGARPGELCRVRVADVDFAGRMFVIRKAKASNDIPVPISAPIEAALRMALKAAGESEWLFPVRGGGHLQRVDKDNLPEWGNALRHNYKTVASTMQPAVEEILSEMLMGHAPKGVSRKYVSAMVAAKSEALREAQVRISARIVDLLGLTDLDLRAAP